MSIEEDLRAELKGLEKDVRERDDGPPTVVPAPASVPPSGVRPATWPEVRSGRRQAAMVTGDWLPSDAPESRHRLKALTAVRRLDETVPPPTDFPVEDRQERSGPRPGPRPGPRFQPRDQASVRSWEIDADGLTVVPAIIWQVMGGLAMVLAAAALFSARTEAQRFGLLGCVIAGGCIFISATVAHGIMRLRQDRRRHDRQS